MSRIYMIVIIAYIEKISYVSFNLRKQRELPESNLDRFPFAQQFSARIPMVWPLPAVHQYGRFNSGKRQQSYFPAAKHDENH